MRITLPTRQSWRIFKADLRQFAHLAAGRFREDRLNRVAQALSYTTLLSLVPLTTLAFGIFSVFPVFEKWVVVVQTYLYSHFVPAAGDVVQRYLNQFAAKSAQLTAFGLSFLIVTALMLMATIEQTFNDIWQVPQRRKIVYRFLSYWAILTLGPLLLGVSLSVTSALLSLPLFQAQSFFGYVSHAFVVSLPFVAELCVFMLLYIVVPNANVAWRHAFIGSVVTALLFEIAKRGFALVVIKYSSYRLVYGAIAALPMFLIWIYVSWALILMGALLVALLPQWGAAKIETVPKTKRAPN